MNLFHRFGFSALRYKFPVLVGGKKPKTYLQLGFRSPAHKGPFVFAEDLVVPDPRLTPLHVFAPASGVIVAIVKGNTRWGNESHFQPYLNYITVQVTGSFLKPGSEFYELAHVDFGDRFLEVGQNIDVGSLLGSTGLNGWMTVTNGVVDSHLHFMVGIWRRKGSFQSVRIRYG